MKYFIATLILVVGLLGCGLTKIQKQAQYESIAWLDMCQLLTEEAVGYKCNRLMPPLVAYEEMEPGLLGWYDGSDTIHISVELRGVDLSEVLIHEGVHYVHVQHGIINIPGSAKEVCWSENEAWTLTGIFYNEDNSLWWRAYPHCWQYYADTKYLRRVGFIYNEIESIMDGIIFED